MNLRNRFYQWMIGRYGMDQLGMALAGCYFILAIIGSFVHLWVLNGISYVPLVLCIFRVTSKAQNKRYYENQKFLSFIRPFQERFQVTKRRFNERSTHRFYRCKSCGQVIRVPKGRGKLAITCPKCKYEFIKKT